MNLAGPAVQDEGVLWAHEKAPDAKETSGALQEARGRAYLS